LAASWAPPAAKSMKGSLMETQCGSAIFRLGLKLERLKTAYLQEWLNGQQHYPWGGIEELPWSKMLGFNRLTQRDIEETRRLMAYVRKCGVKLPSIVNDLRASCLHGLQTGRWPDGDYICRRWPPKIK